jgi:nitronate monooxygenase
MENRKATLEELASLLSGKRGLELYETGNLDRGLIACGQVIGLVHDIPTVKELIERIIKEAEEVISNINAGGTFKPLRKPTDAANK